MIRRILRENRPGLLVLLVVMIASVASLAWGGVLWSIGEMNDSALMMTLFGAIALAFIFCVIIISACSESIRINSTRLPYSDRPPKYRDTWRRQHLESCSQATDTFPPISFMEAETRGSDNMVRLDVRRLWNTMDMPGRAIRTMSLNTVNERTGNELDAGRSVRANTVSVCDEGLPTYEEAMNR